MGINAENTNSNKLYKLLNIVSYISTSFSTGFYFIYILRSCLDTPISPEGPTTAK